jgi:hypothetical protein
MKSILLAVAALSLAATLAHAEEPKPLPESSVEIFRIAPGQHENFLKLLAQTEVAMKQAGLEMPQLFIHQDGGSWDFILVKPHGLDEKKWQIANDILHKQGMPTGPDYFFMIRKMIAEHTDTQAYGPTTATAYLGSRKSPN